MGKLHKIGKILLTLGLSSIIMVIGLSISYFAVKYTELFIAILLGVLVVTIFIVIFRIVYKELL